MVTESGYRINFWQEIHVSKRMSNGKYLCSRNFERI